MTYRLILWMCDKPGCDQVNRREIKKHLIINDDICDRCQKNIHEPILQEVETNEKRKKQRE